MSPRLFALIRHPSLLPLPSSNRVIPMDYVAPLDAFLAEICQQYPQTADILVAMKETCSAQLAYYAAFIFVAIIATRTMPGRKYVHKLTLDDLREFTFFEAAAGNKRALALFDEAFRSYQAESDISQAS